MKSIIAGFALILGASVAPASLAAEEPAKAPAEGLVEVKKGAFQSTWVNPDFDFRAYNKLVIAPNGLVDYRDVGPAKDSRSLALRSSDRKFAINDADRDRFERFTSESFSKQLARSKQFALVDLAPEDRIEPGTLIVRGHVLDVVSNVAPPIAGSGYVLSNLVGEAAVVIELIDPVSGKTVAYAAERSAIQRRGSGSIDTMMESNSVTAFAEVKRWAGNIGSRLAKELDASHKV